MIWLELMEALNIEDEDKNLLHKNVSVLLNDCYFDVELVRNYQGRFLLIPTEDTGE